MSGVVLFVFAASAEAARDTVMQIDPTHSAVTFKVLNKELSFVNGRFNSITGTVALDDKTNPSKIKVSAEIAAKSIDTNDKKRDKHLRGKDFFASKRNKTITFETKKSKKLDDGKFELTGDLTLLGEKQKITVIVEVVALKKNKRGGLMFGGESTFTIKRSDWGMDKMLDGIADEVTVTVSIRAIQKLRPAG